MRKSPIFMSAILLTAVNLLLRLVSTSFQVYISGKIGAAGVGLLQLVLSVGSMALIAGIAGIRTATMYLTAGELGTGKPENVCHILSGCMLYSILCSGAIAFFLYWGAPFLSEKWLDTPQSVEAIRLYGFFLPVFCLTGVMVGYFTAANRIRTLAMVEIAEQLISMGITMLMLNIWANHNPVRACIAVIAGSGIGACLTLVILTLLRMAEKPPKGHPFPLRKKLLNTAVPLAVADDLKAGINTLENIMVPKRLALYPASANPLALFGTVCGMVFPVLMFPAAIVFSLAELLIPEMARCHAAGSRKRIQYLTRRSLRIVVLYGFLFSGLLYLLARPLCVKLYSSLDAGKFLRLYAPLAPMLYCDAIVDAINKGLGQQKICVRNNILTAAMDVTLLFLMLPKYGMIGYFASFLLTHLINFLLSLHLLIKTSDIHIHLRVPILAGGAAIAAAAAAGFVASPLICGAVYIILFLSILTLLGVVSKADLRWLKNLIN